MIPETCKNKILAMAAAPKIAEGFVELFSATIKDAKVGDLPAGTLIVPMYDESDDLQPGDYACELHFVVRKVV